MIAERRFSTGVHERFLVWTCTIRTRTGRVYFAEALKSCYEGGSRKEAIEAAFHLHAKDFPPLTIIDGGLL